MEPIKEEDYQLVTLRKEDCVIGGCPGVYERRLNPAYATYPDKIVRLEPKVVYVVGRAMSKEEIISKGLENHVGEGESVVVLPRSLLEGGL